MPWTPQNFKSRHNKSLSATQAKKASKVANGVLKKTGNDATAIRIANAMAKAKKDLSPKPINEK